MISELKEKFKNLISRTDKKSLVLYRNILLSLGVKGLAILVSLINMPIFMDYFIDSSVLGLWFALLSMLNWVLTFDLGIGNGLRNYLVAALEKNDIGECRHLVSSAYFSVASISLVLAVLTYILVPLFDWNRICNIPAETVSPEVLVQTLKILLIGILLQFVLRLINTILYAMQKSAIPNFLLLCSNVLLLVMTFFLRTESAQENLIRLSYAYVFTANIPALIATIFVFSTKLKDVKVKIGEWTVGHSRQIIGLGLSFLLLQLLSLASFNTREFYIMRFVNPASVVDYQVYHKLYSLVSTFFILATTPLWSAITQAAAQRDKKWIQSTYKKSCVLFLIFTAGSAFVLLLSQFLVNIWLREKAITMKPGYGLLFVVVNLEYMWINMHSSFENGIGKLKIQKIGYIFAAVLLPVLSFIFTRFSENWILILAGNIIALLPLCIMQPIHVIKEIKSGGGEVNG